MRAWLYDDSTTADPRTPHYMHPFHPITKQQLETLGVLIWKFDDTIDAEKNPNGGRLGELRKERGYLNHDIIVPNKLPDIDAKLKIFFQEHLHEDEEIRYILEGSGFFDIRDELDVAGVGRKSWIRIHVFSGDLIVLPAGSYHRFTPDEKMHTKAMRLFKELPKWEAINRGQRADQCAARSQYESFLTTQSEAVAKIRQQATALDVIESCTAPNGECFILKGAAGSLANYPHMRAVNGLLYVSGLSSRRLDGTHVGVKYNVDGSVASLDVFEQTQAVLDNITHVLRAVGADLSHVIDTTCFLVDMKDYKRFNEAYNQFFPDAHCGPTRTTVAVKQLPHPNLLIEIKSVAIDPRVAPPGQAS